MFQIFPHTSTIFLIKLIYEICILKNLMYEFDVIILEDETGGYIAFVPALPGCHTQGDTLEELMKNMKEAIELYLETLTDDEKEEVLRQRVVGIQKVKTIV
jgi:predicted RNase H-like HicB family nuclease